MTQSRILLLGTTFAQILICTLRNHFIFSCYEVQQFGLELTQRFL